MTRSRTINATISFFVRILLIFLIVFSAKILSIYIYDSVFLQFIDLINNTYILLIIISILFFFGEVLHYLEFPLNLISPPFEAIGSLLIATFLVEVLKLVDILAETSIYQIINPFLVIIYIIIFFTVLIVEYVKITMHAAEKLKNLHRENQQNQQSIEKSINKYQKLKSESKPTVKKEQKTKPKKKKSKK